MYRFEYCELWWSDGDRPRLTFYTPVDDLATLVEKDRAGIHADSWEALESAIAELGLCGWELMAAPHHGTGLFFRRHLQ